MKQFFFTKNGYGNTDSRIHLNFSILNSSPKFLPHIANTIGNILTKFHLKICTESNAVIQNLRAIFHTSFKLFQY